MRSEGCELLTDYEDHTLRFSEAVPVAIHAMNDGTCEVAVEDRRDEHDMEDDPENKQLNNVISRAFRHLERTVRQARVKRMRFCLVRKWKTVRVDSQSP